MRTMQRGRAKNADWLVDQLRQAKQETSSWSEWKAQAMRFERIRPDGSTEPRKQMRGESRARSAADDAS